MSKTENYIQYWLNNDQLAALKKYCREHDKTKYAVSKEQVLKVLEDRD